MDPGFLSSLIHMALPLFWGDLKARKGSMVAGLFRRANLKVEIKSKNVSKVKSIISFKYIFGVAFGRVSKLHAGRHCCLAYPSGGGLHNLLNVVCTVR
jgi:hypothetical protein